MAHSLHHAESSARRYGGHPEDYVEIHTWFDASKAHLALPQHRALRHHTAGIFEAESVFGASIINSAGRQIPVRFIGEQHVKEDCRCIPSVADWLKGIPLQPWMTNGKILDPDVSETSCLKDAWMDAVRDGQTVLGLQDWITEREYRTTQARADLSA